MMSGFEAEQNQEYEAKYGRFLGTLPRDEVIGQRLVEVLGIFEHDERLDWAYIYFRLENGKSFVLPCLGVGTDLSLNEVPDTAETLATRDDIDLLRVLGQRIVDILRPRKESSYNQDSAYLLLESGYMITSVMAEMHGTGGAGVFIYAPGEIDDGEFEPRK